MQFTTVPRAVPNSPYMKYRKYNTPHKTQRNFADGMASSVQWEQQFRGIRHWFGPKAWNVDNVIEGDAIFVLTLDDGCRRIGTNF